MPITYVVGDATRPRGAGPYLLPHVCNDQGGWGRGYTGALSRRWPLPEIEYRQWFAGAYEQPFCLGAVRFVPVDAGIVVANIIAQAGYKTTATPCPLDYDALAEGLRSIDQWLVHSPCAVHMPRIGAGLSGGAWPRIEQLVVQYLGDNQVTVYDLPN